MGLAGYKSRSDIRPLPHCGRSDLFEADCKLNGALNETARGRSTESASTSQSAAAAASSIDDGLVPEVGIEPTRAVKPTGF